MSLVVKICGLRTREAVGVALESGADALGFVFAPSPRQVTPALAATLCAGLPQNVFRVAVMRHPTPAQWAAVRDEFGPDWLQTDAEDFAALDLPDSVEPLPVFRDTPGLDLAGAKACGRLLFEAAESGVGRRADWRRARELAQSTRLMLAGGLNPGNVAAAIEQVRPWGVDVSSGVESRTGIKDLARIAAFVAAARRTEQSNAD